MLTPLSVWLDFLVKPVSGARIGELLEKAERQLGLRRPRMLTLRMQEETVILPVQELRFAETYGRKLRLHAGERSIDLRMTMAALEKQLPPGAFFRVHNAYLVSLAHVRGITGLTLGVNPLNALVLGILGAPGLALLCALNVLTG